MPYGDRTGPFGMGPRTGRGMGYCSGFTYPGYMNPAFGGRFFGRGRGFRHWYYATGLPFWARSAFMCQMPYMQELTPKDELEMLKNQAEILRRQLQEVEEEIGTLKKVVDKEKAGKE